MWIKSFFEKLFGKEKENGNGNGKKEGTERTCVECRRTFIFETGEQQFFKMRGLTPPKRCSNCRSKRRHRR